MTTQIYPEPTVGALIFNKNNEIFLMCSHKWGDRYALPGGHIELGETMSEALIREVKEETNLDIYDSRLICFFEVIYDPGFWIKRHFIFFDFICKTKSHQNVVLNDEAQSYVWVKPENAFKLPLEDNTRKFLKFYINNRSGTFPVQLTHNP